MNCPMDKEMTAKIKKTMEEKRLGPNARKSVGFDVISVMMDEKPMKKMQKSNATEYME